MDLFSDIFARFFGDSKDGKNAFPTDFGPLFMAEFYQDRLTILALRGFLGGRRKWVVCSKDKVSFSNLKKII